MIDKELLQILNDSNTSTDMKIRALKKVRPDLVEELREEVKKELEVSEKAKRDSGMKK